MRKILVVVLWLFVFASMVNAQCLSGNCENGSGVKILPDKGRYVGAFQAGLPNGVGSCEFPDKKKYLGEWLNGKPNGSGLMMYPDGSRVRGFWNAGILVRQDMVKGADGSQSIAFGCVSGDCVDGHGIYILPSGSVYSGEFKDGEINGFGVCDYVDGSKYRGAWKQRYPDGQGTKTFPDGTSWTGLWERGLPRDDQGVLLAEFLRMKALRTQEGDIQTGCISGDCNAGIGVMMYADGSRYDGMFQGGKANGEGVFSYANRTRYVGRLQHGLPHGTGILYREGVAVLSGRWENGEFLGAEYALSPAQTGCLAGDCMQGQGRYVFPSGEVFVGSFKDGLPHGFGRISYPNGDRFEGELSRGELHGNGILTFSSGVVASGFWQNGTWMGAQQSYATNYEADAMNSPNAPNPVPSISISRVSQEEEAAAQLPRIWALVVGVAAYNYMPQLNYTDDDAYRYYGFLQSPGGGAVSDDRIRVLIDEAATRDRIIEAMNDIAVRAGPEDMVVMYFSGHGQKGAFLPFDFDNFGNKLFHEEITAALKSAKARYKMCIVDACHSGSFSGMGNGFLYENYYERLSSNPGGMALILSSKSEELSVEAKGLRQGVFSHFLIRGLKGEADNNGDGKINLQELFSFVDSNVRAYTGQQQSPVMLGDFDPKMVVALKKNQ
jgi:hypothetical protein